jgi:23S rRNA pseudouridine2605 synthase
VQVDAIPEAALLSQLESGVQIEGELLRAARAQLLRTGTRNAWLEITLDEGRNRQIRRLLEAFGLATLRLMRVAIGPLPMGDLGKGAWRELTVDEVRALAPPTRND